MESICNDFVNKRCSRTSCKFIHDTTVCSHFWKFNSCKFQEKCRFSHISNPRPLKKRVKNTETFRPMNKDDVDLRIVYHTVKDKFDEHLTDKDVLIVPNLFDDYEEGFLYCALRNEIETCGIDPTVLFKLWHGDSHFILDDHQDWKQKVPTFVMVIKRIQDYFSLDVKATRLNLYSDTSQFKPFHFDSSAVNPEKAKVQNFTLAVSFGETRDAAFQNAKTKTVVSLPQRDSTIYAFCKDTNCTWRHGILKENEIKDSGRISIICWGWLNY